MSFACFVNNGIPTQKRVVGSCSNSCPTVKRVSVNHGRHPGGYITRFTAGLGIGPPHHPFHCWARYWACFLTRFTVGLGKEAREEGYLPTMVPGYIPPGYICLSPGLFTHGYEPPAGYGGVVWLQYVHYLVDSFTPLASVLRRVALPLREVGFLTSGYSSLPRRNPTIWAKKPDTESTFAQGNQ